MARTSEILGYSPQEIAAAAFTASGEAGGGNDLGGVLQTIVARRALNPKSNIVSLVTAPQQFVANAGYTPQQVADPAFGQKVYGSRYLQAVNTLENPNLMSGFLNAGQAATSFRGQALLRNKQPGDIMFDKSGNFYFDKNPAVANALVQRLGEPAPIGLAAGYPSQLPAGTGSAAQQQQGPTAQELLAKYTSDLISQMQTGLTGEQAVDPFSAAADQEDKGYGIRPLIMAGQ